MSPGRAPAGVRVATALFRALLLAYPPSFRRRHGEEMARLFRDRAQAACGTLGPLRQLAGAAGDVAVTAPAEWVSGRGRPRGSNALRFGREVRWAARSLRRSPAFAGVAVVTVALGIGATTAIFTLVDAILLKPLPYPDPERLVVVKHAVPALDLPEAGLSDGTWLRYRDASRTLEGIGAYLENVVNLSGEAAPERVRVALVSSGVLEILGARAAVGRLFTEDEQAPFDPEVTVPVVLSHDLWIRQYGGDPAVVGRTLELNAAPKRVVGIMDAGFEFPRPGTDVWYPLGLNPASASVGGLYLGGIARLAEGVAPAEAERELRSLVAGLAEAHPDAAPELLGEGGLTPIVRPLRDELVGEARPVLWILMGSMALVLLVACANVVNLLLGRAEHRRREMALRLAVGAGRGDVGRFVLAEGAMLAGLGAAAGLALAWLGVRTLLVLGPEGLPRLHEVALGGRGAAFAAGLAAACALAFAAVPFLRHGRVEVASALVSGRCGMAAGGGGARARWALVASQVALALTLLVGAALMVRSASRLAKVDPGFDAEGVLTLEIALPASPYPDHASQVRFWSEVLDGVRALPGVEAAGAVTTLPLTPVPPYYREAVVLEGGAPRRSVPPEVSFRFFTPGYLEALGIPLLEGRRLGPEDRAGAGEPVLVSAALARRLFPGGGAVGGRVRRADPDARWSTVVGVVGDVRQEALTAGPAEVLYVPVLERPVFYEYGPSHMSLALRTTVPPMSLTNAVRRVVLAVDPAMPIAEVRTMERILDGSTARTSLTLTLLLLASLAALFLGAVGIYGVVSYAVGRRTHELGVRLALGARPAQVTRMVVGEGAVVIGAGVVAGILAASWLTRLLRGLLFEVSPTDPAAFLGMAALVVSVGLLASWLPVRRATRADLLATLKDP